jgi:hypothetical protein
LTRRNLGQVGVVSRIVICGGKGPPHGERLDGSAQPAKETYAGHSTIRKHVQIVSLAKMTIFIHSSFPIPYSPSYNHPQKV